MLLKKGKKTNVLVKVWPMAWKFRSPLCIIDFYMNYKFSKFREEIAISDCRMVGFRSGISGHIHLDGLNRPTLRFGPWPFSTSKNRQRWTLFFYFFRFLRDCLLEFCGKETSIQSIQSFTRESYKKLTLFVMAAVIENPSLLTLSIPSNRKANSNIFLLF